MRLEGWRAGIVDGPGAEFVRAFNEMYTGTDHAGIGSSYENCCAPGQFL